MTWIKTIPFAEASEELRSAYLEQSKLYPPEYAVRVEAAEANTLNSNEAGVVSSHSLLPQTLYHVFAAYGTMLSPDLPLSRRQHEMIAATVSSLNTCFY